MGVLPHNKEWLSPDEVRAEYREMLGDAGTLRQRYRPALERIIESVPPETTWDELHELLKKCYPYDPPSPCARSGKMGYFFWFDEGLRLAREALDGVDDGIVHVGSLSFVSDDA